MPVVAPGSKVLVTGANGFAAIHIVDVLLKKGYSVRATIRSEAKAPYLRKLFGKYGDKLEFVIVPDVAKEGAFDNVLGGLDAILHTASPFHLAAEDPEEIIQPAVNGTLGILKSAIKAPGNIKRVIILSSTVSIGIYRINEAYDEEEWNDAAIEEVKTKGKAANGLDKYMASKTLAERAAWELYNKHRDSLPWDMTAINPPYVFGPNLDEVDKPEHLNTSSEVLFNLIFRSDPPGQGLYHAPGWIDVRDVAAAHAAALETEAAANERIIVAGESVPYQEYIEAAKRAAAPLGIKGVRTGIADYDRSKANSFVLFKPEKRERILGIKITSLDDSVRDCLANYKARGWVTAA